MTTPAHFRFRTFRRWLDQRRPRAGGPQRGGTDEAMDLISAWRRLRDDRPAVTRAFTMVGMVVAAFAIVLSAMPGEPARAQTEDEHSDWAPIVGTYQIGCTRATGNAADGFCAGHHDGWAIDINMPFNAPIYATGPGIARLVEGGCAPDGGDGGCNSRAGNYVAIDHGDHYSRYVHLASFAPGIKSEPRMTRFVARELATAHWFDISAAKKDFGYQAKVTTRQGLERLKIWLGSL